MCLTKKVTENKITMKKQLLYNIENEMIKNYGFYNVMFSWKDTLFYFSIACDLVFKYQILTSSLMFQYCYLISYICLILVALSKYLQHYKKLFIYL